MDTLRYFIAIIEHDRGFIAAIISALCAVLFFSIASITSEDIRAVPFTVTVPSILNEDPSKHRISDRPEIHNGLIYSRCPADGRSLSNPIKPATTSEIDEAITKASQAQKKWAKTSFTTRRKLLNTLLQHILDNQENIVKVACLDSGKTKIDASFGEILVTVEKLQWTIKHGEKALAPSSRPTNLLMCYKKNSVIYEPLGVVASCFSWNYPFHSWISLVISGLFTGNAVISKPSEQTCWSSLYYLDIVRTALRTLGHDEDLVQNVICLPDTADHLTSHPGVSHITFIGSRPIAHKVCASAAKALTPVTVELGGKDPCIVLDDKATVNDIDSIVSIIMRGTFQSAGQNCIGIERVIALPKIYDLLVKKLEEKVNKIRLGSITMSSDEDIDMGSMISSASFPRLERLVTSAVKAGAILHTGGKEYSHPQFPYGTYFSPTLLSGVTEEMEIAQNELFAPVCTVMKAESVDHAIQLANGTEYSLGASVFGSPTGPNVKILNRIAREVRSGMVSINDFGAFYVCSLPFGGVKGSGYGRFSGAEGLQGLCNSKSICEDANWARMLGIKTNIPPVLQYPVLTNAGFKACCGITETGYSTTWSGMVRGVAKLLTALTTKKR